MIRDLFIGEQTGEEAIAGDPGGTPVLRRGVSGAAVTYVQKVLIQRAGQSSITANGLFDTNTEAGVKNVQAFFGDVPSGIVDQATWGTIRVLGASTIVGAVDNIKDKVLSMEVSLSMDAVSQISFEVSDPGLKMAEENYWNLRRVVKFQGMVFEIASVEFRQGTAGETVRIEARNRACQLMKRNKQAAVFKGGNATAYAAEQARAVGLKFFGENTVEQKNISQASNDQNNESVWDVLKRLAGQNQFVMFETDGRLFFCSMQFLLGKFAVVSNDMTSGFLSIPIRWFSDKAPTPQQIPGPNTNLTLYGNESNEHVRFLQKVLKQRANQTQITLNGRYDAATITGVTNLKRFFGVTPVNATVDNRTWGLVRMLASAGIEDMTFTIRPLELPNLRKSDDDFNAASLSMQVDPEYGDKLRPGMTISIKDISEFVNDYIVTEVRWNEGTPDAVAVTARTPIEPTDAELAAELASRIDLTGGGFSTITVSDAFNT